jgi:hypothetical protein
MQVIIPGPFVIPHLMRNPEFLFFSGSPLEFISAKAKAGAGTTRYDVAYDAMYRKKIASSHTGCAHK